LNWAAVLGFLLVGILVPADVAQAQAPISLPGAVFVQAVKHPPPLWEQIYHEVEKCVGHKGKFKDVRWFVTAQPWAKEPGDTTYGMWRLSGGKSSIIVARGDTGVVRHESLHDIAYHAGFRPFRMAGDSTTNPEHPTPAFGKCAERYKK
jgi:hypothetical protein